MHRLSDVDAERRSATCSKCGTVKIYRQGKYYACSERVKADAVAQRRKFKYGLTAEDFERMLDEQGGACPICLRDLRTLSGRARAVDHDHACCPGETSCGQCVRSILCMNCNTALGQFNDNIDSLKRAIKYLEG